MTSFGSMEELISYKAGDTFLLDAQVIFVVTSCESFGSR